MIPERERERERDVGAASVAHIVSARGVHADVPLAGMTKDGFLHFSSMNVAVTVLLPHCTQTTTQAD